MRYKIIVTAVYQKVFGKLVNSLVNSFGPSAIYQTVYGGGLNRAPPQYNLGW